MLCPTLCARSFEPASFLARRTQHDRHSGSLMRGPHLCSQQPTRSQGNEALPQPPLHPSRSPSLTASVY